MEEIRMETWDRREHFEFFLRNDLPFYNVNFNADITGLREYAKGASVSLENTAKLSRPRGVLEPLART